jgi:hypothetical protein
MKSGRIGKIEEETQPQDLDQLEREMAIEAEEENEISVADAFTETAALLTFPEAKPRPAQGPAQNQNMPHFWGRPAQSKFTLPDFQPALPTRLSLSRFAPSLYEKMLMQMGITISNPRDPKPFGPFLPVDDKAARRKPANDTGISRFLPAQKTETEKGKSRFIRLTMETLMQLGAMPGQLLAEVGRLKNARERRFESSVRLERSMGQGHEDAELYVNRRPLNTGAERAKDKNQPAPKA